MARGLGADIPEGYRDTPVGVIPKEWRDARLGEVSEFNKGITYKSDDYGKKGDGIAFFTLKCVSKNGGFNRLGLKYYKGIVRANDLINSGDIVIANTDLTRDADVVGCPVEIPRQYKNKSICISMDLTKITPKKELNRKFVYYFLQLPYCRGFMKSRSSGSTVLHLDVNAVKKMFIPLPSLPEQRKIATILSSVDASIQETDAIIAQTEQVKRGLMQELFTRGIGHTEFQDTKVGRIPVGWKVKKLGEIANIERGKFSHRPRNDPDYYGGGTPFIQTGDVCKSNGYILNFSQTLNQRGLSVSKIFPKGTIVITIAANIGYSGILKFDAAFPDSLIGILSHSHVDNEYLNYYLSTQQIEMDRRAIEGAQKNINIPFLNSWYIKLPPPHEQRKIATLLSYVDEKLEAERGHRAQLETMKKGLMQNLLTGKKRVKVDDHA